MKTEKQQYLPLTIPREQAELMVLNEIHPDSPEGRAILSRSSESFRVLPYEYPEREYRQHEISLNPISVESAQTWFVTAFYIAGALGVLAGGIYLVGLAVQFLAPYADVLPCVAAFLLIIPLVVVLSKIKTTKRVIHERPETVINKTYIQNNY